MNRSSFAALAVMTAAAMLVAGCHVETDKHGDGDNVKVSTPFGGVQVKTNSADVLESIDLAVYPGAQPEKKDKDNGAADVNVNFGSFQMRVNAVSYRSDDSPEKVEKFYRGEMKRFGDVVACRDGRAVGQPISTPEGLTCDNEVKNHVNLSNHKGELQLKAGSKQRQHIVQIDAYGGGTKIGLVALVLPNTEEGQGQ